jgi:hypothetical protein
MVDSLGASLGPPSTVDIRRLGSRILGAAGACVLLYVSSRDHGGPQASLEGMLMRGAPSRQWNLVDGAHWQLAIPVAPDTTATPGDPDGGPAGARGACPASMFEIRGQMKTDGPRGPVEYLQDTTCSDWISREFPARCARFDEAAWQKLAAALPTRAMRYCIDAFEYPNRRGQAPVIEVSWHEAVSLCEARGERLCTEDEWTFACEGEDALPYPYGYRRDAEACVIDHPWRAYDDRALAIRDSAAAMREIDYLWQGEPSGARPRCRSPFGVYDMTGNVDEWTRSVQPEGYRSIFKGGYWGPVRARCRAATRAHNEDFHFYQQGFRCCSDVPLAAAAAPAPETETDAGGDDAPGTP